MFLVRNGRVGGARRYCPRRLAVFAGSSAVGLGGRGRTVVAGRRRDLVVALGLRASALGGRIGAGGVRFVVRRLAAARRFRARRAALRLRAASLLRS